jgi:uncharacterized protein (TIGR00106 family)
VVVAAVGVYAIYLLAVTVDPRPRPPVTILDPGLVPTHSFPSGQVGTAVVLYGCVVVLTWTYAHAARWWVTPLLVLPLVVLVALRTAARTPADPARYRGHMIVAFSISPMSSDETGSVTEAVAAAVRVVRESGLPNETNAMFTNIEGEWDEVMVVVKRAVEVVAEVSPRVGLVLKADIRPGYDGQLSAKVQRIEEHLAGS